jgi:N-acetylmuramoyl-L-alanine amidase
MIEYLVVHCTDSPNDRDVEAADIHQWHLERGFDGIGYNFVIQRSGKLEKCRPTYWEGAHAAGHNHHSLGICLVGRDQYTLGQYKTLKELLYVLKFQYQDAEIVGHYELDDSKTCPNLNMPEWLKKNMPGVDHTVRH